MEWLNLQTVKSLVLAGGEYGQGAYAVYVAASVVFPPLLSAPLWPVAVLGYGYTAAVFLTTFGTVAGSMAAFGIARHLGRPAVVRLLGQEKLGRIDSLAHTMGWKGFFWLRLVAGSAFDFVSYAAGLSKMSGEVYFLVTTVTSLAWTAGAMLIINGILRLPGAWAAAALLGFYVVGIGGLWLAWEEGKRRGEETGSVL